MSGMSYAEAFRDHIAWMRLRNMSPGTIYQRKRVLARLAVATGRRDLLTLTAADLDAWQQQLTIGPSGRYAEISHVCTFYRWALRNGWVDTDPTLLLVRPRRGHRLPRPIPEDDLRDALDGAPERVRPWLVLAAWCGLRACEIAPLRRDDVLDTADPPILIVTHGKGDKQRPVPIGPAVLAELPLQRRGVLFPRLDGRPGPVSAQLVSALGNRALHEAGVASTFHALRHRFGTRMYQATRDIRAVQDLMGHSSPATTAIYTAWARSAGTNAAMRLDAELVGA